MGDNEETAKDLEIRIGRLSERLGKFKERSVERQREEAFQHISELQRSVQRIGEPLNSH